ncbi:MAG: type VI secretion system tube protein Hcp [Gammaproteobacteria bacterium]
MPVFMFMKMDDVAGDSKNYQHEGWSDVQSWHWEMTSDRQPVPADTEAKTAFNEISLVKLVGMDSMAIRSFYAAGTIIPTVKLNIIPAVGKREAKQKYLFLQMEDVLVKSISTGGNVDDDVFTETITLLFARVHFAYNAHTPITAENPAGTSKEYTFAWDIAANKALTAG